MTNKSSKIEWDNFSIEVRKEDNTYMIAIDNKIVDEQLSVTISDMEYNELLILLKSM